jgi:nicotinate-nucleotide adenylyltransferase
MAINSSKKTASLKQTQPKVGLYSGTFDPIHLGHITFALQAIEEAGLHKVYFLPERVPRDKETHELFGHRVAMIKQAIKPHPRLAILELDDKTLSVQRTLPKLEKLFNKHRLVFLFGSDKIPDLISWPYADKLLKSSEIVIGLRQGTSLKQIMRYTAKWPKPPLKVITSYWPAILSTEIRRSLENGQSANGLLKSVSGYIKRNWLYISLK